MTITESHPQGFTFLIHRLLEEIMPYLSCWLPSASTHYFVLSLYIYGRPM